MAQTWTLGRRSPTLTTLRLSSRSTIALRARLSEPCCFNGYSACSEALLTRSELALSVGSRVPVRTPFTAKAPRESSTLLRSDSTTYLRTPHIGLPLLRPESTLFSVTA